MFQMRASLILSTFLVSGLALAGPGPIEERQELMKETRDAAKVIGGMIKQERDFDSTVAMDALKVWQKTAAEVADLFPEGSAIGHDTEAKVTIWSDRAGFDEKLAEFASTTDAAIAAKPQSLDALKASAGPVFKTCKGCHEGYRVEKD